MSCWSRIKMTVSRSLWLLLTVALLLCGCAGQSAPAETEAPPGTDLTVYCFDAGKADAFLLYTENGAVLIDAGSKGFGKEIVAYLGEAGIERLDYLIITHFDRDHVGGAAKVVNSVPVGTVLQTGWIKDSDEYDNYVKALSKAGIEPVTVSGTDYGFTLDGAAYTVNGPAKAKYAEDNSNNSSLIVSVVHGQNRLLFTGDARDERLAEFLNEDAGTYDFLKVPYHGRWQETLAALVGAVKPDYAVITSGDDARTEDDRTLALLEQAGASVFLTREGAVTLRSDGKTLSVSQ